MSTSIIDNNKIRLIVGLGNPGKEYSGTMHNVGFMLLEKFASEKFVSFNKSKKLFGKIAEIGSGQTKKILLMPDTYMNESGRSVNACLKWFNLELNNLLIIVDDMDLPLGKLRLRVKGGSGGHNGLKSTISNVGSENFLRLRIGIGSPAKEPEERRIRTNSHVLGKFTNSEKLTTFLCWSPYLLINILFPKIYRATVYLLFISER